MTAPFTSGRLIDLVLAFAMAEGVAIILYRRQTGRGPVPAEILPTLAAGICLLGALRCAVGGWWPGWLWACLAAALAAHLADLSRRWR